MYLIGKRIMLRALELEDMELLRETINDPYFERMVGGWSFPVSKNAQLKWFESLGSNQSNYRYAIESLETKEFFGMISLLNIDWKNRSGMTAIKLSKKGLSGKGIATDAEFTLMEYVFNELNLHRLTADVLKYNTPSVSLHKKIGGIVEGVKREAVFKNGQYNDVLCFGILKEDYIKAAKINGYLTE